MQRLLVATGLLAVLLGVAWWANKQPEPKTDEGEPKTAVLKVNEDNLRQIDVVRQGETTRLKRVDGNRWEIVAAPPVRADDGAVAGLLRPLRELEASRVLTGAQNLADYGLHPPRAQVVLEQKDGKTVRLLLGDNAPAGGESYAKLEGDNRVFLIPAADRAALDVGASELRDKRLFTLSGEQLSRIELASGKGSTVLEKAGGRWRMVQPVADRVDGGAAEELVSKLSGVQMDNTAAVLGGVTAGLWPQAALAGAVTLTGQGRTERLELRKTKDGQVLAQSSVVAGTYPVSGDIAELATKPASDLRAKKLFEFGFDEPSVVQVQGGPDRTFRNQDGKWTENGKPVDGVGVQSLLDNLRDLEAIQLLTAGEGKPVLTVTVGKEAVRVVQSGNQFFARRGDTGTAYELDSKAVERVQQAAKDVKAK